MILLHQLFPALVRCNKAMVVGDPLQLEPIIPFSQSTIEQYHSSAFTKRELSDTDDERYSPTAIYTATAYHSDRFFVSDRNLTSNSIGTVHTFQGGQKSVIILSTRQLTRYILF